MSAWRGNRALSRRSFGAVTVTSADGTTIGFRRYGNGPGLLLIHGGMNAAQDLAELAALLSDAFTVWVVDRRGRGTSGPFGPDHTIDKQVEDVRAVLDRTGAQFVFGLSAGGVVALAAAVELPQITRLAVYEPPLDKDPASWTWLVRYDREIAAGRLGAALVTAAAGTGDTSMITRLPRWLTERLLEFVITAQGRKVKPGDIPLKDLLLTMHDDAVMVRSVADRLDTFQRITADVLLMTGRRSPPSLREPVRRLAETIPNSTVVELVSADHTSPINGKRPHDIARELRTFFS